MWRITRQLSSTLQPALVILGCWLCPAIVLAQSATSLDRLIFDPVLLADGEPLGLHVAPTGLAALATAGRSAPSIGDDRLADGSGDIAAYERDIAEVERNQGQFAPVLVQDLLALGKLYQGQGDHEAAIAVLERADYISRRNFGLYEPGQIPIIESQIASYLALDRFAEVSDKQRYLMFLNRKLQHSGSLAPVPSFATLGDTNMATVDQALLFTAAQALGPGFRPGRMDDPGVAEIARYHALSSLFRARQTYSAAISSIIAAGDDRHERLLELEYKYLETLFLSGFSSELIFNPHYYMTSARETANLPNRWTYLRRNEEGYEAGNRAFGRILATLDNDPAIAAVARVRAHLEYADWQLLFGWSTAAADEYGRAYAMAESLDAGTRARLFSPAAPVQLPLFTAKPNSREKFAVAPQAPLAYAGYIDTQYAISRHGTARHIRVIGASAGTPYAVEKRLQRYLKNSPFRPRIQDGRPVARDAVTMRYYYTFYTDPH